MKESDIKHLEWIYHRLRGAHKENEHVYYMQKFKSIIEGLKPVKPMPETKRYRLEIPEEVPREYMEGRTGLYVLNGAEVELMGVMTGDGIVRIRAGKQPNRVQEYCPRSWLVEIIDKPVTVEEYVKEREGDHGQEKSRKRMIHDLFGAIEAETI